MSCCAQKINISIFTIFPISRQQRFPIGSVKIVVKQLRSTQTFTIALATFILHNGQLLHFQEITQLPVVVENSLNICICGRVGDAGCAWLVGDQGVKGVDHGQQVHHLRLVLRQVLSGTK